MVAAAAVALLLTAVLVWWSPGAAKGTPYVNRTLAFAGLGVAALTLYAAGTRYEPAGCFLQRARPVCFVLDRWTGKVTAQRPERPPAPAAEAEQEAAQVAQDPRLDRLRRRVEAYHDSVREAEQRTGQPPAPLPQ